MSKKILDLHCDIFVYFARKPRHQGVSSRRRAYHTSHSKSRRVLNGN
jgi:hypothetical protein